MSESSQREEELFAAALALPAAERQHYLEQACGGDAELLHRVEALLRVHEKVGGFLETPAVADRADGARAGEPKPPPEAAAGTMIGRYRLLQKIGEGGCGVVYMAEQKEPVRRRVALKVIRLGMDTKEVIARFEAERQALALMDHPNIARVFDAGATDTGRPYFVMELVRGVKITDYCDQQNLSTAERLNLFVQVCHAVQHAHQKGIIHRDIKPSNILVTLQDGEPVPKVIDFGIAKATQGRLTDQTLFTAFEQFIGTPAYMSPEQAELSSVDVDTRSDIYSLGVLLYELLTGRTPFEAKELLKAGLDEMRRQIREVEPPKPSTRLRTLEPDTLTNTAQHRATEPPKLIHLVRGDLDWIVMRCLEKKRARRYETAAALAADLQRHLEHRPVVARRPSPFYRFRKFFRRNRPLLLTGGGALLVGLGVGLWFYREESSGARTGISPATPIKPSEAIDKVSLLGEPEAIALTGNLSFSARAIRDGLAADYGFRFAAHPDAPLGEYAAVVRAAVVRGYRGLGFPDIAVTTRVNRNLQRLEVAISEGPRFTCGEVHVVGTDRVPAADVVRALTDPAASTIDPLTIAVTSFLAGQQQSPDQLPDFATPTPKETAPADAGGTAPGKSPGLPVPRKLFTAQLGRTKAAWVPGHSASFADDDRQDTITATRQLMDARGFPLAEIKTHVVPDRATGRADLQVEVQEGPATVVGAITVRGNTRNTAEEIIRCTGLATGMSLDAALLAHAKVALWTSARFYAFGIAVHPPTPAGRACALEISVEESETMPLLREALPRHQAALVRFANWMTTGTGGRELDLIVDGPQVPAFSIALNPDSFAVYAEGARTGSLLALLVRADGIRLFGSSEGESTGLDLSRWKGHATTFCRLTTNSKAVDPVHRANLSFGLGFVRNETGSESTPTSEIVLSPIIACQYLATKATPTFANGEVAFEESLGGLAMHIRFREETGELIEWNAVPVVDPKVAPADDVVPRVSLGLGGAEFARIARHVDQDWGKLSYDPARRRSLVDLVLHSDLADQFSVTPASKRAFLQTAAVVRLGERLFSAPEVRARLDLAQSPDDPDFPIPADPNIVEPPNTVVQMLGLMLYEMSRVLGPPTTWPARLGRELSYVVSGQTGHTTAVLDDLYDDPEMGPAGSLVTAKMLRLFDSPHAWRFARRALERSSLSDFRMDYHNLLESDSAAARLIRDTLPAIVALSDRELDEIVAGLSPSDAQLVRQAVAMLRGVKAEGAAAVLRPFLEIWWERQMRPDLAAQICVILGCDKVADPTAVAAIVNGAPLSRKMLALGRRQPGLIASLPSPLSASLFVASQQPPNDPTLDTLATLMLAEQEAVRQGAHLSDAATDRGIEDFVREQYRGDRSAFEAMLAREGVTLADFRELRRLNDGLVFLKAELATEAAISTEAEIAAALTAPATPRPADSAAPGNLSNDRARVVSELTAQKQRAALQDRLNRLRATAFVYVIPPPAAVQAQ